MSIINLKHIKHKIQLFKIKNYIMNSCTNDKLTRFQQKIFKIFIDTEEKRYKHKLSMFTNSKNVKSLISFCIFKSIWIFIPVVLCAESIKKKKKIDKDNLYSIIGPKPFKDLYFEWQNESFIKQKWYKNNRLPIIANIKNRNIVVDGNHRLAQQIYYDEIEYYQIDGNISWKNFYKIIKNKGQK